MSYKASISSSESEYDHCDEVVEKKKTPIPKAKSGTKRVADKVNEKKPRKKIQKNTSYRDGVIDLLRNESYDSDITNSITFRQGDGVVTIKNTVDETPSDFWTLSHYKSSNIEHIPSKDRWKHSEATVKLHTSAKTKDQSLHGGLNQIMQTIFDTMLQDPTRSTIKCKTTV